MSLKTIDSAPKDGRYILLFSKTGSKERPLKCDEGWWESFGSDPNIGRWIASNDRSFQDGQDQPTHWCEIPTEEDNSYIRLLNLVADIRAAVGDPTGKLMQDELVAHCRKLKAAADKGKEATADEMIQKLEEQGLGWDIGNTGRLIEARIWAWPYVIARYRAHTVEPLAQMLWKAVQLMPTDRATIKSDARTA
jgi:hypothetical protein